MNLTNRVFSVFLFLLVLVHAVFLFPETANSQVATIKGFKFTASEWPMFGYDAGHTHWNRSETTLRPPLTQKMRIDIEDLLIDDLSVADRTLFVAGMERKSRRNKVYAVDAFYGKIQWAFTLTGGGTGGMDVTPAHVNGLLFFGGQRDDKLYALDAKTGKLMREWRGMKNMYTKHPSAVGQTLYFIGEELFRDQWWNRLYCMDVTRGDINWEYRYHSAQCSPTVHGGVVYVLGPDGLHALDANKGEHRWQRDCPHNRITYPVADDGTIYIVSGRTVYAIDTESERRERKWTRELPLSERGTHLALAYDQLYVATWEGENGRGMLYALNAASGREQWNFDCEAEGVKAPAIANGVVYLAGWRSRMLFALDAKTGRELGRVRLAGQPTTAPIVAYGRVYVASHSSVYAFGN